MSSARQYMSFDKKKSPAEKSLLDESSLEYLDLDPFLLKLARDTITSGEGPSKALDYALRASKCFEMCAVKGEPSLDLVTSLHVVPAIDYSLGGLRRRCLFWNEHLKCRGVEG
ncbi:unnamed protein product [Fraxinus pennsylvanica]|uniref:Uncharacterized protein n=1 Tax=Fraxinus pennsylvanica TaxID=56036 RepID=A0AAD1Z0X0_9LAMI|nr:unnamed protein product [Fraxinus pennsylvanica]